jgi:hypothetical protein
MTELHNMSVPFRSVLTVQREEVRGRRYRVAIGASVVGTAGWTNDSVLTRCFRQDGAACALALLNPGGPVSTGEFRKRVALHRRDEDTLVMLRRRCDAALSELDLPEGFGFFVEETSNPAFVTVPAAAAIAILAARSGPLYLPGRFEPSLITACGVTLFFPF